MSEPLRVVLTAYVGGRAYQAEKVAPQGLELPGPEAGAEIGKLARGLLIAALAQDAVQEIRRDLEDLPEIPAS